MSYRSIFHRDAPSPDFLDDTWGEGYARQDAYRAFTRYGELARAAGSSNILRHAIRNPPRRQRGGPPQLLYPAARIGRAIAYSGLLQRARQRVARRNRVTIMQNARLNRSIMRRVRSYL